jgi:IMP dehydrogenase
MMAVIITEPSHTFNEYLLIPGYTSSKCIPDQVDLKTPLVKFRKGDDDKDLSVNGKCPYFRILIKAK